MTAGVVPALVALGSGSSSSSSSKGDSGGGEQCQEQISLCLKNLVRTQSINSSKRLISISSWEIILLHLYCPSIHGSTVMADSTLTEPISLVQYFRVKRFYTLMKQVPTKPVLFIILVLARLASLRTGARSLPREASVVCWTPLRRATRRYIYVVLIASYNRFSSHLSSLITPSHRIL